MGKRRLTRWGGEALTDTLTAGKASQEPDRQEAGRTHVWGAAGGRWECDAAAVAGLTCGYQGQTRY